MKVDLTGIGRRIQIARVRKNVKQEALAEAAGISPNHLSHIENKKSNPSLKVLVKIMDYLDVEPNEMFCESVSSAAPYLRDETSRMLEDVGVEDLIRINETVELAKLLKSKDKKDKKTKK